MVPFVRINAFLWLGQLTRPVNNLINTFLINPNIILYHVFHLVPIALQSIL